MTVLLYAWRVELAPAPAGAPYVLVFVEWIEVDKAPPLLRHHTWNPHGLN